MLQCIKYSLPCPAHQRIAGNAVIIDRDLVKVRVVNEQINQTSAEIQLTEQQLARINLTAPFDGVVIEGDLTQTLDEKSSDENRRLGFNIHGNINEPGDIDIYSFHAEVGTEVWLDIDRTTHSLDTVI